MFGRLYHVLHGSASTVVRTGLLVNGNRPKSTTRRPNTPSPIQTKLLTNHYVHYTSPEVKGHHRAISGFPPTKAQYIQFLLVFIFHFLLFFSFSSFLGIAYSRNGWTDFHQLYVKRRGLTQGSSFWGLIRMSTTVGTLSPKNP